MLGATKRRFGRPWVLLAVLCAAGTAACKKADEGAPGGDSRQEQAIPAGTARAVARLEPLEGYRVRGAVTFARAGDGVRVVAEVVHLDPGKHGFHIHEKGDCSAPDASSAGGHFNPLNARHASPQTEPAGRHAGDLGNLSAPASGVARYNELVRGIDLTGDNSIIGRAVVIHEGEDDLFSQPSGNAGKRIACGVIEAAE